MTIEMGVITGAFGIMTVLMKVWHGNIQREIRTALLEHREGCNADLNRFALLLERLTSCGDHSAERITEMHHDLTELKSAVTAISGRLIRIETTCRTRCETVERFERGIE